MFRSAWRPGILLLLLSACDSGTVGAPDATALPDTGGMGVADIGVTGDTGNIGDTGGMNPDMGPDLGLDLGQMGNTRMASGSFSAREFGTAAGGFTLEMEEDGTGQLVLSDDFAVSGGQALHVFIHSMPAGQLSGQTAMDPAISADLGPLNSITGAQSFPLLAEQDVANRMSVLVHCTISGLLFASAPIQWASN